MKHSGGAIGLIDALFLHIQNPGITTRFVGYGSPRVGNQEWADYIDSLPISVTRINNKEDIVPILPGRFLGYHHASGEVHIQESGAWLACPGTFASELVPYVRIVLGYRLIDAGVFSGQDNTDARCTIGTVPNIFEGEPNDHDGPYDGIETGCDQ